MFIIIQSIAFALSAVYAGIQAYEARGVKRIPHILTALLLAYACYALQV